MHCTCRRFCLVHLHQVVRHRLAAAQPRRHRRPPTAATPARTTPRRALQRARVPGRLRVLRRSAPGPPAPSRAAPARRSRSRADRAPQLGGKACPHRRDPRAATRTPCAVDCVVNDWPAWTTCTKSCGAGAQKRSRASCSRAYGGKACPHHEEARLQHAACAVHCATCHLLRLDHLHQVVRHRRAVAQPLRHHRTANGGYVCPYLEETRSCNAADLRHRLRHLRLRRLVHLHQVVRHRLAEAQPHPDRAHVRRQGLPALRRDPRLQRALPAPSTAPCRPGPPGPPAPSRAAPARRTAARATVRPSGGKACPHSTETRACNDARVRRRLRRRRLDRLVHLHQVVRHRLAEAQPRHRRAPLRRQGLPALHEARSCNSAACPVDCAARLVRRVVHLLQVLRRRLQVAQPRRTVAAQVGGKACPHTAETGLHARPVPGALRHLAPSAPGPPAPSRAAPARSRAAARHHRAAARRLRVPVPRGDPQLQRPPRALSTASSPASAPGPPAPSRAAPARRSARRSIQQPTVGGKACPHSAETRACNAHACAVDCVHAAVHRLVHLHQERAAPAS